MHGLDRSCVQFVMTMMMMLRGYLAIVLLVAVAGLSGAEETVELYSDKYDDVDVQEILNNDRLRDQYYNCLMDTGPCVTPDAMFYKTNFPELFVTKCKRCTEKQKVNFGQVAEWYTENRKEEWDALVKKLIEDAKKMNIGA